MLPWQGDSGYAAAKTGPGAVNKVGGSQNCVSCAVAGDSALAGNPASAIKLNPDVPFPNGMPAIEGYAGFDVAVVYWTGRSREVASCGWQRGSRDCVRRPHGWDGSRVQRGGPAWPGELL